MRLLAALCFGLLLAPVAAANEPIWTRDQRQAHRDAVFAGRVVSTTRLYEAEQSELAEGFEGEYREEVWDARVEVLDVRKGHPLLEVPVVDLYYVRPADGKTMERAPAYVELSPGDERLFFAEAALDPVGGGEALFVELGSDAIAGISPLPGPGIGLRLVTGDWRVWSWSFEELVDAGYAIEFSLSGRVQTESLAPADRWQLTADGTLELLSEAGTVSFRFRPQERLVFAHTISEGIMAGKVIWLGPAGSDFEKLSRRPTTDQIWKMLEGRPLPKIVTVSELRVPVPKIVKLYAWHGIRLEPSYDEQGQFREYRVSEPATPGFHITVQIWKFPEDWTEREIQDYLLHSQLGHVVHGRYVLWWSSGENVDEGEDLLYRNLQSQLVTLFEDMEL